MEAFVINLDSRPDRWSLIKKRFKGSEIKLRRVSAVVRSKGGYGYCLSVIKVLNIAKKEGLSAFLILDDDCLPTRGFKTRWKIVKDWLDENPDKWDVYSGGAHTIIGSHKIGSSKGVNFYDPVWCVGSHWLYVPERSYDKLLDYYKFAKPLTQFIPHFGLDLVNNFFKTLISEPFMAYQDSGYSNILKKHRNTRKIYRNAEQNLRRSRRRHI
jgi:hypothetical protein